MIEPERRKAIFLLHQGRMPLREISRRLGLCRATVRTVIRQEERIPPEFNEANNCKDPGW